MHITYEPKGICARKVEFDIEDGVVKNISFPVSGWANPSVMACNAWRGQMEKQLLTNCLYLLKWVPFNISWPP